VERVHFGDGRAADRRECAMCGEQWMAPASQQAEAGGVETIELRGDTAVDDASESADGIEEWFR
jgi:hypothetical protein